MNKAAVRANQRKLIIPAVVVLLCAVGYMFYAVKFNHPKLFRYSMTLRSPKLVVMLITAFTIDGAALVFQTIINNIIVTPRLLGMNSLYSLIHTAVVFVAGSTSLLATNSNLAFAVDLVLMAIVATIVYSFLFEKTHHNVLYILLIGTVLTSFFSSIQTTMTRIMDLNEYDSLPETLVASFENINSEVIVVFLVVLAAVIFALRKEPAVLDVISLGKDQAINLGVDYDKCIRKPLLGVTLCIAVATAMVGPISFLGLIMANLSRQFLKTYRHSQLVLGSTLFDMAILIGGVPTITLPYLESYNEGDLSIVGSVKTPDLEAVMVCEPDLILMGGRASDSYDELSEIAPVLRRSTDNAGLGLVESVRKNASTIGTIFGESEQVDTLPAQYDARIATLAEFAEGHTCVPGMCTSGSFILLGNDGRCSLIVNEIGFDNIGASAATTGSDSSSSHGSDSSDSSGSAPTHGNQVSFETIVSLNPEYIFVMDRDSAINASGAQLASEIMENELIMETDAYQNGNLVILENPGVWYPTEGGITALGIMLSDLESALLS